MRVIKLDVLDLGWRNVADAYSVMCNFGHWNASPFALVSAG
jgi:hypothetical protein